MASAIEKKVIELPKHRQEETGIKRIRRRELLPPFPERFFKKEEIGEKDGFSTDEKFDNIFKFLTDGGYPEPGTCVHVMHWSAIYADRPETERNIIRFKRQGLYFQEIRSTFNFYFNHERMWPIKFRTPVFIFGNKNQRLNNYIDVVLKEGKQTSQDLNLLKYLRERDANISNEIGIAGLREEFYLHHFGRDKRGHPPRYEGRPLRWCHAELALVPTKRSLNVLFFETE